MRSRIGIVSALVLALVGCGGGEDPRPGATAERPAAESTPSAAEPVKIDVGAGPGYATFAFGRVWVGNHNADTVVAIDPATNAVTETVEVPGEPTGIGSGFGSIWTFTPLDKPRVRRIDPRKARVEATVAVDTPAAGLGGPAKAAGAMWIAGDDRWLLRIDPRTNRTRKVLRLPAADVPCPGQLTEASGHLWMAWECGNDRILRIDPARGSIVATIRVPDDYATWMTAQGKRVWALTQGGKVLEIDTRGNRIGREGRAADRGASMVFGEGALWVRANADELVRVDPDTLEPGRVQALPTAPVPGGGVAVGGGAVWAANFGNGTVWRLEP